MVGLRDANESRPADNGTAIKNTGGRSETQSTNLAARARRHDHGVLVLAERKDGVVTSQVYSNLPAAETKVWRTRERGLSASLVLVRIVPVPHVALDELDGGGRS